MFTSSGATTGAYLMGSSKDLTKVPIGRAPEYQELKLWQPYLEEHFFV